MKIRKVVTFSFIFIITILLGISTVDAKNYTSYKKGDKITVYVNDNTKLDFYVIEDSSSDNDTVKSLSHNFVEDNLYTLAEAEVKINSLKNQWTNVKTILIPHAKELLGEDVKIELEDKNSKATFRSPSWVSPQTNDWANYWLADIPFDDMHMVIDGLDTYYNTDFYVTPKEDIEKSNIRSVITVSKEYVVGGITLSENDKILEQFVNEFKKSELVKLIKESGNTVDVTYDDSSMKIISTSEGKTYETNYTYSNGILTYVKASTDEQILADSLWNINCLITISNIKGYDYEDLSEWIDKNPNLTLANDGIEFVTKEINLHEDTESVDISINGSAFSEFKLDIKNGIKTYKPTPKSETKTGTVKNPDTGLPSIGVGVVIILGLGVVLFLKSKKERVY